MFDVCTKKAERQIFCHSNNLNSSVSLNKTLISWIIKQGKSEESLSDFRLICVINCNNQILIKLISNRVPRVLSDLM